MNWGTDLSHFLWDPSVSVLFFQTCYWVQWVVHRLPVSYLPWAWPRTDDGRKSPLPDKATLRPRFWEQGQVQEDAPCARLIGSFWLNSRVIAIRTRGYRHMIGQQRHRCRFCVKRTQVPIFPFQIMCAVQQLSTEVEIHYIWICSNGQSIEHLEFWRYCVEQRDR